jgi:hypothetical protein
MSIPRATPKQTTAIRNLMFSRQNIERVRDCLIMTGKMYLGELSVGEAAELLTELIGGRR